MTKNDLRTIYRDKRIQLTEEERGILDKSLLDHLKSFDWSIFIYVHVYLSIDKFKEPDTIPFIDWLKSAYPNIKIIVSKSNFETGQMMNFLWNESLELVESRWGILEPLGGEMIEDSAIDLVIVPLLIADREGNRVGYGKGFYDRFLSNCKAEVLTIGLSYFEPIDQIDDVNEWDVRLNLLFTPDRKYEFK